MIIVESLELHVSNHCNLSCRGCSHITPLENPCFINLEKTLKSLYTLKKVLHCKVIRLLGGEPTLNPNLLDVVKKIKEVNIADEISIPTNGILLEKLTDEILEIVDIIEISNYNYSKQKQDKIMEWAKNTKDKHNNIKIIIYMYETFREPYSTKINPDTNLTEKIYKTCIVANKWQCFNVYEDYIFKCPESMAISKNINNETFEINGIKIEESELLEEKIKEYLNNKNYLSACRYCLGTTGKRFPIKQVSKEEYKKYTTETIANLLDKEFLEECLTNDIGDMRTVKEIIEF